MKKYLVLATLFLMTSTASAANITWHGGVDYRYNKLDRDDNLGSTAAVNGGTQSVSESTTKSSMYRVALGAKGGWDNIEWGITVGTTGAAGNPNADWVFANSNTAGTQPDFALGIRDAWFRYGNDWGFGDIGFTIGRHAAPHRQGNWETFLDNDVRFDGFSQTWKWGSFGLNLGQYYLGAINAAAAGTSSFVTTPAEEENPILNVEGFSMLYAFQLTFDWRFNDDFSMGLAAGMYQWSNTLGTQYQNFIPNTVNGANASGGVLTADASNRVSQENSRHIQVLLGLDLPYMLDFEFEIVFNKDQEYGAPSGIGGVQAGAQGTDPDALQDSTAWTLGLSYGELKKSQDFMIGYAYSDKGLGAVHNTFTEEFTPAGYSGHTIKAAYNLAQNFHLGLRFIFLSEKDPRNTNGIAVSTIGGTAGNEKIDRNYWEVTTGIHF